MSVSNAQHNDALHRARSSTEAVIAAALEAHTSRDRALILQTVVEKLLRKVNRAERKRLHPAEVRGTP